MKKVFKLPLLLLAVLILILSSCEDESKNNSPVITAITPNVENAFIGEQIILTADVEDIDNDNITYFWTANGADIIGSKTEQSVTIDITESSVDIELNASDGDKTIIEDYSYQVKECQFYDLFNAADKNWNAIDIDYKFDDGKCFLSNPDTTEYSNLVYYNHNSEESFLFNGYKTTLSNQSNLSYADSYMLSVSFNKADANIGKQVRFIVLYAHPGSIFNITSNWKLRIGLFDLATNESSSHYVTIPTEYLISEQITNLSGEDRTLQFEVNPDGKISLSIDNQTLIESDELKELINNDEVILNRSFYYFKYGIYNDCELQIDNVYIW